MSSRWCVAGSDDESEDDSDDDSDWEESDEESESEAGGYDLDICPPGCDQVRCDLDLFRVQNFVRQ